MLEGSRRSVVISEIFIVERNLNNNPSITMTDSEMIPNCEAVSCTDKTHRTLNEISQDAFLADQIAELMKIFRISSDEVYPPLYTSNQSSLAERTSKMCQEQVRIKGLPPPTRYVRRHLGAAALHTESPHPPIIVRKLSIG
mmetsp:Transcript_52442/g.137283  ORF Transcript_52442/g.137283 Transcript_52442/m.137283 type:complete len:141 (-) Transcript_52442:8-430(-)